MEPLCGGTCGGGGPSRGGGLTRGVGRGGSRLGKTRVARERLRREQERRDQSRSERRVRNSGDGAAEVADAGDSDDDYEGLPVY